MKEIKVPAKFLVAQDFDPRWINSTFFNLKLCSPKTKGFRMESLAKFILSTNGFYVQSAKQTDFDFEMDDQKLELKGSTIVNGSNDHFTFLQIRPDQSYDILLLMTLWFDGTIQFYKFSKKDVLSLIESNVFKKQHGGKRADSRTYHYVGEVKNLFKSYFMCEFKVITNG